MTRALAELLGARDHAFRHGLRQLEQAAGRPSEDIRLSSGVAQQARASLRELGLDPLDTTGAELYSVLQERLKHDDGAARQLLGVDAAGTDLMPCVQHLLQTIDMPKKVFALKASTAKRLLKKNPPKKAMRRLGYRSLDSLLKHEPIAQLYAATRLCENAAWQRNLLAQYKQLLPTDFEEREIQLYAPDAKRWQTLSHTHMQTTNQNILLLKELGAIVLLPYAAGASDIALATLLLALHAVNDLRVTSAFLKLHQVRPDFGVILTQVVHNEPYTEARIANAQPLPWRLVQQHFVDQPDAFVPELFEPHVQPDDLAITSPEQVLARLHPRFEFWRNLAHIGLLHGGEPVSLNLTDAALNFCNHLPFERRIVHYFRASLWSELMRRYLHQGNLEQAVREQLGDELVDEKAVA